eukprot:scaffold1904_cov184-Amphora_coffeaeformis.AAC.2
MPSLHQLISRVLLPSFEKELSGALQHQVNAMSKLCAAPSKSAGLRGMARGMPKHEFYPTSPSFRPASFASARN